jgi:DNA-binding NtrC family response regulator
MLIVIGPDDALLEGLAQSLVGAGHRVSVAHTIDEAADLAQQSPPLLFVVDRETVAGSGAPRLASLPMAPGGAIVIYRTSDDHSSSVTLPHRVARITLADLELPLERQRLVALAQYVKARAKESGRVHFDTPPERHAP